MSVYLDAEGLLGFKDYLNGLPEVTTTAARLAINQTVDRKVIPLSREEMLAQIAFPKGYLNDQRFSASKRATSADLEAIVTARGRPTSLARFLVGAPVPGKRQTGVTVRVKPGESRVMKSAFVVTLKAGNLLNAENGNVGIVLRTKDGQGVHSKKEQARPFGKNLYLLYGPSVEQVFRDVSDKVTQPVLDYLGDEFLRQFSRLAGA
jgi:hypothetical protein